MDQIQGVGGGEGGGETATPQHQIPIAGPLLSPEVDPSQNCSLVLPLCVDLPSLLFQAADMASSMQINTLTVSPRAAPCKALKASRAVARRSPVAAQAGFIGSPENLIMVSSVTAFLVAGRFGLAPTSNRTATAGLQLVPQNSGQKSGDPSGFNAVDVLGHGTMGHVVGVGIILGLKANNII